MRNNREIALEQAAVALLSEVKAAGYDLSALAKKAKSGIHGNATYTWVSEGDVKVNAIEAVDYLVTGVK